MYNQDNEIGIKFDRISLNTKKLLIGIITFLLVLIVSLFIFSKTVTAERDTDRVKIVASIEIKKGDTLWTIAEDYMTDDYDDINEYILEIKNSNGLSTDTIHAGHYLIVPYYVDAGNWHRIWIDLILLDKRHNYFKIFFDL